MQSPRIGPRELVYENRFQQVYRVTADFGQFTKEYFINDTGQRAGIVAIRDGSVLLVRQYRHTTSTRERCRSPGGSRWRNA